MDPNANLREQLRLARKSEAGQTLSWQEADRLAELVIALHEWLIKGGFLPDAWKEKP